MRPEEIFPQKIARAEEPGEQVEGSPLMQKSRYDSAGRLLEYLVEELIEMGQRFGGVRSGGQAMRKLLNEDGGHTKGGLSTRVGHLASMPVRHSKAIMHVLFAALDRSRIYRDSTHRQGIGKRIEKTGRIAGSDVDGGPRCPAQVFKPDMDRLQHGGRRR